MRHYWSVVVVASAMAACGGKAIVDGEGAGSNGAGGHAGSVGGYAGSYGGSAGSKGGAAGVGGSAGWGGSYGGYGGGDGGAAAYGGAAGYGGSGTGGTFACGQTHETLSFRLQSYDGTSWGCSGGVSTEGTYVLQGDVVQASGSLILNSCPPNADCMPMESYLSINAPGLHFYVPTGAFVEVYVNVKQGWGCTQVIEIRNLPEWGGVPSPYGGQPWLWFAGADGGTYLSPESTVTVSPIGLNCYPGAPTCGAPKDDFVLRFSNVAPTSNLVDVPMGTTQLFAPLVYDNQPPMQVRNLRSYESGNCDELWNYGFWMQAQPMED